jgi:hypothetical protein
MESEVYFENENLPPGHKRFFSGGNLEELRKHLMGSSVNFGKLWVRAGYPDDDLKSSANYTFIREDMAHDDGEPFSEKVVITGIVPEKRIKLTGGMNEETEYISGPVIIDGVYAISGEYGKPVVKNITSQVLLNK